MGRTWFAMTLGLVMAASAAAQDLYRNRPDAAETGKRAHGARERAYQGRNTGPEQTERFSGKYRIGRDGRVSLANVAGDITITGGSGDEVSVEALKRTRGGQGELSSVRIEVDNGAGRLDIRTQHTGRNDHVSVDYTVTVPAGASLEVHSISGNVKVTGVHGSMRAETVSGNASANDVPRLESIKSVSGNVSVSGITQGDALSASSVSGNLTARSIKVRSFELSSVSGDVSLTDVTTDRLGVKSISGGVEYAGAILKSGSYDFNVHSGTIRLTLANPAGFVLNATSFSGTIRSELPLTIGGDSSSGDLNRRGRRDRFMNNHSVRATYGDGSATVNARSFSGDIVINKR